jgi:acetoin utilization deacetylase AcuC-like enzyme
MTAGGAGEPAAPGTADLAALAGVAGLAAVAGVAGVVGLAGLAAVAGVAGVAGLAGLPVVWHPDCLRHEAGGEVWLGVWEAGTEVPLRASVLLDALVAAGATITQARPHGREPLLAVHDARLVEHLATIWQRWEAGGYPADYGRTRVVPYVFPTAGLLDGLPLRPANAVHAQAGEFCYDTMTLVGPGSWEAIGAAADAALSAADLVAGGVRAAYALCRPPGHHAGRASYGGSCYLNNAAIAAAALRAAGADRVAVIDIDAHHGNGTQAIFYDRADVYYGSVHVDPRAGWFPHYMGHADERGSGAGEGANRNLPLAPGTGDEGWLAAVAALCAEVADRGCDAIVVSLGVDAADADPESPLRVSADGYRAAGELIGALGPVVAVQEGGYDLTALGGLVVATLSGLLARTP